MILERIVEATKQRVEALKIREHELREEAFRLAENENAVYPFEERLKRPGMNYICEVKKASPSKGIIAEDFPYIEIAKEYEAAGAACISVLTEPDFFLGKSDYLKEIRQYTTIPLLRKDFIIDPAQIYEAKLLGADCVLLICRILSERQLKEYLTLCETLHLSALVEAHTAEEVMLAAKLGARIIGVNNRNLKDFTIDFENSIRLRNLVSEDILFVAESGIKTAENIAVLNKANINAVLIGETLMRAEDKREMLCELSSFVRG